MLLVGMQTGAASGKQYLEKVKMELPYDPVIFLLGIYLKRPGTLMLKNISISMFLAVLFTIAKLWKQPRCPSVNECIKQLWDIYTMEYYLAVKKEEILPLLTPKTVSYTHLTLPTNS